MLPGLIQACILMLPKHSRHTAAACLISPVPYPRPRQSGETMTLMTTSAGILPLQPEHADGVILLNGDPDSELFVPQCLPEPSCMVLPLNRRPGKRLFPYRGVIAPLVQQKRIRLCRFPQNHSVHPPVMESHAMGAPRSMSVLALLPSTKSNTSAAGRIPGG